MSSRRWITIVFLSALPLWTAAAQTAATKTPAAAQANEARRIDLPGAEGKPFPYTVEVPQGWQIREMEGAPGIWLGPADAQPPEDPRLIYVRISRVVLDNPEQVVANIKASDAKQADWAASVAEVREVGGVKAVLVRMDSGAGEEARSTLALKLPLPGGGVDFMASARREEFEKLLPIYEKVLFSVRRRS